LLFGLGLFRSGWGFSRLCADGNGNGEMTSGWAYTVQPLVQEPVHLLSCMHAIAVLPCQLSSVDAFIPRRAQASADTKPVMMADVNSTLPPPQDLDPTHQAPPSGLHDKGDARAGSSPGGWKEKYTPAKPDPWVQRKFAVGYVSSRRSLSLTHAAS
jgi:hypothetical protein